MKQDNTTTAEEYLQAFSRGEERGFTFYFKTFYPALCLFANKYVRNKQAAEDIVSDSFISTWSKREMFSVVAVLKTYLYRSVYHSCLRWLERSKKTTGQEPADLFFEPADHNNYIENIVRMEMLREVEEAMNLLPAKCKKVFTKLYIEGKTVKQTAEELTLSVSTVKTHKAKGLWLIRAKLFPILMIQAIPALLYQIFF
ncbi:MAG TPA: RNA polymerase sigma-70 factor [Chitinophagaceae bacterium]|nr:RNA polymerase sigma-70 factor [Chitinophagaceae bacterium]